MFYAQEKYKMNFIRIISVLAIIIGATSKHENLDFAGLANFVKRSPDQFHSDFKVFVKRHALPITAGQVLADATGMVEYRPDFSFA